MARIIVGTVGSVPGGSRGREHPPIKPRGAGVLWSKANAPGRRAVSVKKLPLPRAFASHRRLMRTQNWPPEKQAAVQTLCKKRLFCRERWVQAIGRRAASSVGTPKRGRSAARSAICTQVPRHQALTNGVLAGTDSNGRSCQIASYDGNGGYNFKWQVAGRIGRLRHHTGKPLSCRKLIYGRNLRERREI
jgi:hypothetical protein